MLAAERGAARNTLLAYQADLDDFAAFAAARGCATRRLRRDALQSYMAGLQRAGLAARTAARRLSALRQFHRFLLREGDPRRRPHRLLDAPRLPRTLPKYLTEQEVDALLAAASALGGRPAPWRGRRWRFYTPPACGYPNCCLCRAMPWPAMRRCC